MPLALHTVTAIVTFDADGGNTVFNQAITVKIKSSGLFADLFSDEAGLNAIPNPSNTDINGVLSFWVESGDYVISSGGRSEDVTIRPQSDAVLSVAGKTGIVTLDSDDVSGVAALAADQTFTGTNTFDGDNIFTGANTFAGDNIFTGTNTFPGNKIITSSGSQDTKLGDEAGASLNGGGSTAFGFQALRVQNLSLPSTAFGANALSANNGSQNTAVGFNALKTNFLAGQCTAMGNDALRDNDAFNNTAVGAGAGVVTTSGQDNTIVGAVALANNLTGRDNVALGASALISSVGNDNVAVGSHAGLNATGASNVFIGKDADVQSATDDNSIVIGANVVGNGSNTVTIGDNNITETHLKGDVKIPSATFAGNIEGTTANFSGDITPLSVNGLNMANVRLDKINSPIFTAIENSILDGDVTLTRASEKTGIDRYGILRTFANDVFSGEIEDTAENVALHNRDFSNAVWVKVNGTGAKNAVGLDAAANSASSFTATSASATILQTVTQASQENTFSPDIRRKTGTGTIEFTDDNGSTWTDVTSSINTSTYTRFERTTTQANPVFGFRITTSGDAIEVDFNQLEVGVKATSRIATTTAPVTRVADDVSFPVLNRMPNLPLTIEATLPDGAGGFTGTDRYIFAIELGSGTFTGRLFKNSNSIIFDYNGAGAESSSIGFTPNAPLDIIFLVTQTGISITLNKVSSSETVLVTFPVLDLSGDVSVGSLVNTKHLNAKMSVLKINDVDFNSDEIKLKQGI